MKGHIEVLIDTYYISDIDMVRLEGEDNIPLPKKNAVIVFLSFLKGSFHLHSTR
jgi:hypothetical protein